MLRHPADGSQWRKIDSKFKDFAGDAKDFAGDGQKVDLTRSYYKWSNSLECAAKICKTTF
jgi:hypothetical protein